VFNSKFYKLKDANLKSKLALLILAVQVFFLIIKERPQVIISTGAAPGFFAIFFAKVLFNSKTIWIDSIANGEEPSLSGLKVRKWADLWLTQWPDVAEVFKMKYVGELL
jgi:UDP-N-acetylglucosamine:LPS N-acetylglucosamine transferase